jgi:hypothetical protein
MTRRILLALVLLAVSINGAWAANEQYAVVRIPSHGASATVIDTGPGYSWILGCGHAYQGSDRNKKMVFDIRRTAKGEPKQVGSWLMDVDYQMDLSLVLLGEGPLDFVAPVGPHSHSPQGHQILSCGFDEMKFPMHQDKATILSDQGGTWYTKERPWHGRSGGGLIDVTSGCLIGVTQGYETEGPRRGMYVDLITIQKFIGRYSANRSGRQQQLQPFEQFWQPQRKQVPCPGGG